MSEPFDFESFIAGTQLARGPVSFYRVDHRPEIARLTREHDALPPERVGDDREQPTPELRRVVLAAKIAELREEMEASRVELIIRTLTPDEFKSLDSDAVTVYDQLAMQAIEPALDRDQWKKLADKVGTAQWSQIVSDANALILSKVAVPDFSQSVSRTLSPPTSSEN